MGIDPGRPCNDLPNVPSRRINNWKRRHMMHADLEDVRAALSRFMEGADFPQTFLLTGQWGVGKTYLYRDLLKAAVQRNALARRNHSYCSLFGIESLDAARDRIFESLVQLRSGDATESTQRQAEEKYGDVGTALEGALSGTKSLATRIGAKLFPWAKNVPAISGYAPLIRMVTFGAVRDALICIDDLERRSAALPLRDVLGLVSHLREERLSKVIVITNEDTLDEVDRKALSELREKVFDLTVDFQPPPSYALSIAVPEKSELREEWVRGVDRLKLTNIRVLRRILGMVEQLSDVLTDAPERTKRQAIQSLLLLGTIFYQPRAGLPPVEFVMRPSWLFGLDDDKKDDPQSRKWKQLLFDYGWGHADEFDTELMAYIRSGCFSKSRISYCVEQAKKLLVNEEAHKALEAGWNAYHGSLKNNEDEVIATIFESHTKHAAYVTPINLDGAVRLLRELDAGKKADQLIATYVAVNKGNDKVLDLINYPFSGDVQDKALRQAFAQTFQGAATRKDLREVLTRMSVKRSWGGDDREFLASTTADEFEAFFSSIEGDDLHDCIKTALQFGRFSNPDESDKKIETAATEALTRLASKSRLNQARLARHGIKPKTPMP